MGKLINLFSTEEPVSTGVQRNEYISALDNAAFNDMLTASTDPNEEFLSEEKQMDNLLTEIRSDPLQGGATGVFGAGGPKESEAVHAGLLAAGMTPGLGNVADLADATLFILEGKFGDAAWSAGAAIPIIGQMVAGKRALKAAKESGEEMVTLYRGVDKYEPEKWIKDDMVVGPKVVRGFGFDPHLDPSVTPRSLFTTTDYHYAATRSGWDSSVSRVKYLEELEAGWYINPRTARYTTKGEFGFNAADLQNELKKTKESLMRTYESPRHSRGATLEFEIPKSWVKKYGKKMEHAYEGTILFPDGLPQIFLKMVY